MCIEPAHVDWYLVLSILYFNFAYSSGRVLGQKECSLQYATAALSLLRFATTDSARLGMPIWPHYPPNGKVIPSSIPSWAADRCDLNHDLFMLKSFNHKRPGSRTLGSLAAKLLDQLSAAVCTILSDTWKSWPLRGWDNARSKKRAILNFWKFRDDILSN